MKKLFIAAAAAALLLAGCTGGQQKAAQRGPITTGDDAIAQTKYGRLQGYCDDGIYTFKGIRYAQAERFMPPTAPPSWEGVKKAQVYGGTAMQNLSMRYNPNPTDYDFGFEFKNEKMTEDCQFLNVWTPALDGKKRPVFMWIHGGGFNTGSAIFLPAQEGRALAEKGDIVVVTVNHRLNILGYIDLRGLGGKYSESVNLGQQDLVKALEWVHDNIAAFGGDPDCVTIGGQSGGGRKTSNLMAMPSAQGLFHRAIVQSGSALTSIDGEAAKALGIEVVKQLGLKPGPDVDLSGFTYEELVAAGNRATRAAANRASFGAVVDGKYIIQHPFDGVGPTISQNVPMLIGSNLNEACYTNNVEIPLEQVKQRLARTVGIDRIEAFMKDFDAIYPGSAPKEYVNVDLSRRDAATKQATAKMALGAAPAFNYLFAWKSQVNDGALGACHGMELPFTFNNVANQREMTGGTPEAYKMADVVSSAWIAFIKTGDPNCSDVPKWEPYDPAKGNTMVFDNVTEVRNAHDRALLQYMAGR